MFLLVGDILLTERFRNFLERYGFFHINSLDDIKKIDASKIEYIISRGAHFRYTKEVLEKFFVLKKIFLFQIGIDNVDISYCLDNGIEIKNFVSEKSVYAVAELTIASLIMGIRQAVNLGCRLKKSEYTRTPLGYTLESKKIGVMGAGRIGSKVIELLKNFPVDIAVYDIIFNTEEEFKISFENKGIKTFSNLSDFFDFSEYITIHIPGVKENIGLLDYDKLSKVKGVVNMSRAGIVKENDVLKLIKSGKLQFYVTDVVNGEPDINKINKDLLKEKRVFIMPHIGANTYEVQEDIINQFLQEFEKYGN